MARITVGPDLSKSPLGKIDSKSLQLPELEPHGDWRVFRLQQFIDGQEGRLGWRLTDACRDLELGVSAPYAARLFRQHVGLSIREYTKRKRLRSAAMCLEATPLSIKEISSNLGYSTPAEFFRQFKETFQVTPSSYRNRSRSDASAESELNSGTSYALMPHDA
ncbi:MAG: helix-turn-helix transcriptional regulator [Actinomycetota bacterium]